MSWIVSIFFNAPHNLDHVILKLENLWLINFRNQSGEFGSLYRYEGLGILIDLFDQHDMEDDMGIAFSHYSFQIDIEIIIRVEQYELFGRNIAFYLAHQLFEKLEWPCIVVENLQRQLGQFPNE